MDLPGDISQATANLFKAYDDIRGKDAADLKQLFWDQVVLTTADEEQAEAFKQQIEAKLKRKELPKVPYHVFADPPGPKAGCGGSTMFVIQKLHMMYGSKLWDYRILLLNAGGQSQRLPSASVLGKIFTALPIRPFYQVLDLKLALYLPYVQKMSPGFFHAAADTIELYDPGEGFESRHLSQPGFTAAAHPSSLRIGTNHGVYVLQENGSNNNSEGGTQKLIDIRTCLEVLQKPSVDRMRERGAVQMKSSPKKSGERQEFVYTDGYFFFDHNVSKKLMEFYAEEAPLGCEIDSYGDFLQALGPRATSAYTRDLKNVSKVETQLVETREKIFNLLKGTPLSIVLLNSSKFYHLGTMKECLMHFCEDPVFAKEIGLSQQVFSCLTSPDVSQKTKRSRLEQKMEGCLIHSLIPENSTLEKSTIAEYCHFDVPLKLGNNSIISNCAYTGKDLEEVAIPEATFMHTIVIKETDDSSKFVTVIFGIQDNLKKKVETQEAADTLPYLGDKSVADAIQSWSLKEMTSVFPRDKTYSLWNAELFPSCKTMSESLEMALQMLDALRSGNKCDISGHSTFSMAKLLQQKDITGMLKYRDDLYSLIKAQ